MVLVFKYFYKNLNCAKQFAQTEGEKVAPEGSDPETYHFVHCIFYVLGDSLKR